jgi:outer membrane receptor protein involved in Fe transport
MKNRWFMLALALVAMMFAAVAGAQTTGDIDGTVMDPEGKALPGVTVEAKSSSLLGTRTTVTDESGRFRLPALSPGTYTVTASLSGFATAQRDTVKVSLGGTATISLTMKLSTTEQVVVTGEVPVVDTTTATAGLSVRQEVIQKLPLGRNYSSVIQLNPGVQTDTAETQGRAQAFTIYGATSVENQYLVDGVNTTNVIKGFQGKSLTQEFIEEVQVKTSGYEAEYGRAMGGVINVVTKSGGNEFKGDVFGYFDRKSWTSESKAYFEENDNGPDGAPVLGDEEGDSRYVIDNTQFDRDDYGADLGGFFMKDRIWFFAAYNRVDTERNQVPLEGTGYRNAGVNQPIDSKLDVYSGKLTFRIGDETSLVLTAFGDPEKRHGPVAAIATGVNEVVKLGTREIGGLDYAANLSQLFGARALVNLRYAQHKDRYQLTPDFNDIQELDYINASGTNNSTPVATRYGFGSVNGPVNNNESTRKAYKLDGTVYFGDHELKGGVDWEKNKTETISYFTGGQRRRKYSCIQSNGSNRCTDAGAATGTTVYYRHDFWTGSTDNPEADFLPGGNEANPKSDRMAWFLQDSWKPMSNLTVNLGLRYDSEDIQDYSGKTVIDLKDEWQPRLGIIFDPANDGSSKIAFSYGRFYYAIPTDMNVRAFGRQIQASTFNYDELSVAQDAHAPLSRQVQGGAFEEPVQDDIKGIYQDEITLGFDKALDPTMSVGIRYTYRNLGRTIEDRCDIDYEDPAANYNTCVIFNPGSDHPFATGEGIGGCTGADYADSDPDDSCTGDKVPLPSIPDAKRKYHGLELVAKKQIGTSLFVQASYIYSRLRGNYDGAARVSGGGQTDPGINADYDYAIMVTNSDGKLYLDRPHSFKLDGAWTAPFGLTVGASAHYRSGAPKNRLGYMNSAYGTELFLQERGTAGREKADYDVDATLGYTLENLGPVRVTFMVNAFNLLNRQTVFYSDSEYNVNGPVNPDADGNYEFPTDWEYDNSEFNKAGNSSDASPQRTNPRSFRLGVRVSF